MGARRKWSDAQYEAIWRLHRRGIPHTEIAARSKAGEAGVPAFEVPRRSVSDIIQRMEKNGDGARLSANGRANGREHVFAYAKQQDSRFYYSRIAEARSQRKPRCSCQLRPRAGERSCSVVEGFAACQAGEASEGVTSTATFGS